MLNPSEINAPPSLEQLYAMLGEVMAENRVLKSIISQHPEIIASHNAAPPPEPPESNGTAQAVTGVIVGADEED